MLENHTDSEICLKARHTLIMKENAKPKCSTGRDIMGTNKTLHTTKHVADIPLTHLIYGCEFETKGKRYRVTPSKPMDNLIKLIDGSEPYSTHVLTPKESLIYVMS